MNIWAHESIFKDGAKKKRPKNAKKRQKMQKNTQKKFVFPPYVDLADHYDDMFMRRNTIHEEMFAMQRQRFVSSIRRVNNDLLKLIVSHDPLNFTLSL